MPADTFTYTMKNLDREKWAQLKASAALMQLSVRALIDQLIDAHLSKSKR